MNEQQRERLADEVTAAVLRQIEGPSATGSTCSCHRLDAGCCPDQLQHIVRGGVSRLGLNASAPHASGALAGLIDHTLLKPDATQEQILELCDEAAEYQFAAVCIQPTWVRLAASRLRGSGVGVCSVVGFPLGANTPDVKAYEARRCIFDGASEIDMVINIGALKSRDYQSVESDIRAVVGVARELGTLSKAIIETALLTQDEKIKATTLVAAAGADFVKTSTGFASGGATPEDVALMRQLVGSRLGVKAAGGVRDAASAEKMVEAGATRIGASAGIKIVSGETSDETY